MKVRRPTVGPILGYTTPSHARIFVRGAHPAGNAEAPRRAHGVIRFGRPQDAFSKPRYFKLNPNFDLTGVVVLDGLRPSTRYEYQVGWIHSEVDNADLDVDDVLDWEELPTFEFTTGAPGANTSRSFVLGSCRYLLRLFGGTVFDDRGDKTFRSILRQLDDGEPTDALIMVGDQIYADDLSFVSPDRSVDEYLRRYRDVFGQKHVRELMARVPTYMTLDDHEIEDNWPSKASERDLVTKFPAAMHAYQTYQMSHSPLFETEGGRLTGTPDHLWYHFRDGCADFFATDTRTERWLQGTPPRILGDEQLRALESWLADGSGRVKFVLSAVPFFGSRSADKWEGFVEQRDQLLEHIRTNGIRRVVFLSGDVHASMSSELVLGDDPAFKVVSVVSSAFFWPYPHPASRDFQLSGALETRSGQPYRIRNSSRVRSTDNFVRVTASRSEISVRTYGRKGALLGTKRHAL